MLIDIYLFRVHKKYTDIRSIFMMDFGFEKTWISHRILACHSLSIMAFLCQVWMVSCYVVIVKLNCQEMEKTLLSKSKSKASDIYRIHIYYHMSVQTVIHITRTTIHKKYLICGINFFKVCCTKLFLICLEDTVNRLTPGLLPLEVFREYIISHRLPFMKKM